MKLRRALRELHARTGLFDQLLRFAAVGIASNLALYLLYILATVLGVEHKLAMTMLFALGALQTFIANKTWSFRHRGLYSTALIRYCLVYILAYAINLAAMVELVDRLGYSDRLVQGAMIVVVAVFLFGAQKYWVFREKNSRFPMEHS
jgi:putative flippase GtrA